MKNYAKKGVRVSTVYATVLMMALAVGCTKGNVGTTEKAASKKQPSGAIVEGQVLARVTDPAALEKLKQKYTVTEGEKSLSLYVVSGPGVAGNEQKVADELEASHLAEMAQVNGILKANEIAPPRDPKWMAMWALKNYGQENVGGVTEGKAGADIKALDAWQVTKGSRDIVVAVIDTGVDYTHPDLKANIWYNEKERNGSPGVDDDGNGYVDDIRGWDFVTIGRTQFAPGNQLGDNDPMDGNGHGTHVSGTIGAVGNNGIGVTGINWNVRLMPCKFLSDEGSGTNLDEIRAIKYAMDNGADVANASYGGGAPSKLTHWMLKQAGDKGLLFIAAAGNDGTNNDSEPHFPSNYSAESFAGGKALPALSNVISVAATNARDGLAWFSNYGYQTVDIAAPGVQIMSTIPVAFDPANPYAAYSGTSMATPHVVGAAALTLAALPELRRNPAELKRHLMQTADVMPNLTPLAISGGRLNIYKAVKNDKSESLLLGSKWVEEAYSIRTPSNIRDRVDRVWKVTKPGAKAIRLHIDRGMVDTSSASPSTDFVGIYDGSYRLIMELPEETQDVWLPPVMGDTLYVKFSNAVVSEAAPDAKEFSSLADVNWGQYGYCQDQGSSYLCSPALGMESIFPSFFSDGVIFDKISYVPAEAASEEKSQVASSQ